MVRKECVVLLLFVTLVCVSGASKLVSSEKSLTGKTYSKALPKRAMMSTTLHDTSSLRKRSIQEQGGTDVCADIISPNWNMKKQGKSPCPTLVVWVPKKDAFTEFVKINDKHEVEGGFSIAIFCYALQLLPYNVRPIFKPFINDKGEKNGTYDQLLRHIEGQTCEAVAGDVTIRGNRAQYVSFTVPYLSAEVYMLVRGSHDWTQTLWTFSKPFTTRVWVALVGSHLATGSALEYLEIRGKNPEFESPFYVKLVMIIWFPISAIFFHEGRIKNRCSKVVLVTWLCMIFIVSQIFTATLSSWLTLDQLRPRLPSTFENVGYQDGSFLKDLIIRQYNCTDKNLVPLTTIEDYKGALSNGTVNVIFDELPYIQLFLAKYGSEYMKFGPINQESGIAFAFPLGSPLIQTFSKAVINVTESSIMMEMKKKYLGYSDPDTSQANQAVPQILDIQSFIGLFIFMGIVIIAAIFYSEIAAMLEQNNVGVGNETAVQDTLSVEDFVMYMTIASMIASHMSLKNSNDTTRNEENLQVPVTLT